MIATSANLSPRLKEPGRGDIDALESVAAWAVDSLIVYESGDELFAGLQP